MDKINELYSTKEGMDKVIKALYKGSSTLSVKEQEDELILYAGKLPVYSFATDDLMPQSLKYDENANHFIDDGHMVKEANRVFEILHDDLVKVARENGCLIPSIDNIKENRAMEIKMAILDAIFNEYDITPQFEATCNEHSVIPGAYNVSMSCHVDWKHPIISTGDGLKYDYAHLEPIDRDFSSSMIDGELTTKYYESQYLDNHELHNHIAKHYTAKANELGQELIEAMQNGNYDKIMAVTPVASRQHQAKAILQSKKMMNGFIEHMNDGSADVRFIPAVNGRSFSLAVDNRFVAGPYTMPEFDRMHSAGFYQVTMHFSDYANMTINAICEEIATSFAKAGADIKLEVNNCYNDKLQDQIIDYVSQRYPGLMSPETKIETHKCLGEQENSYEGAGTVCGIPMTFIYNDGNCEVTFDDTNARASELKAINECIEKVHKEIDKYVQSAEHLISRAADPHYVELNEYSFSTKDNPAYSGVFNFGGNDIEFEFANGKAELDLNEAVIEKMLDNGTRQTHIDLLISAKGRIEKSIEENIDDIAEHQKMHDKNRGFEK